MSRLGAQKADQLEALVDLIEAATPLYGRAVLRNTHAWIASAVLHIEPTSTIDEAAQRALADSVLFGEHLGFDVDPSSPADRLADLRTTAISAVRALQASLMSALPSPQTARSMHC